MKPFILSTLALPCLAVAQAAPQPPALPPVVVTATRVEAAAFDLPASIDRIDAFDAR